MSTVSDDTRASGGQDATPNPAADKNKTQVNSGFSNLTLIAEATEGVCSNDGVCA